VLHVTVPTDPDKRRSSGLSRELVLYAPLQIIDQDGVDGLSMRKLARALGRPAASAHRHTPTTKSRPANPSRRRRPRWSRWSRPLPPAGSPAAA